ncbi:MAG TPA: MarR family winged helix-turn-helix transcriptional regulator [Acidimicrobiales bacterium]|nr:MarR family winged helix-turn-helix transcriptional regulator [Acidimicrobiales bacterium]
MGADAVGAASAASAASDKRVAEPLIRGVPAELADHTGFLLSKLGRTTSRRFAEAMEPFGLDPRRFAVITVLAAHDGVAQQELAERLLIHPSSMVAVVDDCETAGLLARRRDPADRRRYAIHLTPKGRSVLARARDAAAALHREMFAELDAAEQDELHRLLLRLATTGPLSDLVAQPALSPPA